MIHPVNPLTRIHFNEGSYYIPMILMALILGSSCKSTQVTSQEGPGRDAVPKGSTSFIQEIPGTAISFEMAEIPGGSFEMGSPDSEKGRKADEGPAHQVQLDAFWMGRTEVTWEVFELFFKQNKSLFENIDANTLKAIDAVSRPSPPYEDPSYGMGKEGYPAVSMSVYSALVFCKWLSELTGRFYRLPTEAEWEYAARAGTQTAYSFGEAAGDIGAYAVYYGNSGGRYAPVGSKKPNPWGLYDMHGNVAEWTLDMYEPDAYGRGNAKDPWTVPTVIHPRVYRGGSWDDNADKLRSAARTASDSRLQKRDPQIPKSFWWFTDSNFIGFRLVSPITPPSTQEQAVFWQTVLDE